MTILEWVLIGIGAVLFLGGAVMMLIGFLKKKSLILFKIVPGAAALVGLVTAIVVGVGAMQSNMLTMRENYVACRLIEVESYQPAQLAAQTAFSRNPNVQSAQLASLSLALEKKYSQAEMAAERYQKRFADSTLTEIADLCKSALDGEDVQAKLLLIHKKIKAQLSLSEQERNKAESIVNIQAQVSLGETGSIQSDLQTLAGETDPLSCKAIAQGNMALGNMTATFEMLEQAALNDSSFPARAALAQLAASGVQKPTETPDAERADLEQKIAQKNQEIDQLYQKVNNQAEVNEVERQRLQKQIAELEEEVQTLYDESNSIYVKRAVNYILAQNPSSDDEMAYNLVLAQLYFRMGDMETSRTYLEKALSLSFTGDNTGYLSVEMADVLDAYDNSTKATSFDDFEVPDYDSAGTPETDQESDAVISNDPAASIQTLLWSMTQYTSYGDVAYTETIEGIEDEEDSVQTTQFSAFLLETLQDLRTGLHIGKVDTTNYPEISVSVNVSKRKDDGTDYTAGDFKVFDQGKEITDFELVQSEENEQTNVCLVVDHSGSMSGDGLFQAKRAVSSFVQTAGNSMNLGLAVFDHAAQILCPITDSKGTVQHAMDTVTADGGTNISEGLLAGMSALQGKDGNRIIVLLSDGADSSESAAQMRSVISQLNAQGIVVYAVGFDFADSSYLSGICESTGGKFLRAQTSEELASVYQTIEKFLTQDYVIRFTVKEDEQDYEREIRISLENGVFDEREYFVGVDPDKIEQEANQPPQANFFEQIGGSGKEESNP